MAIDEFMTDSVALCWRIGLFERVSGSMVSWYLVQWLSKRIQLLKYTWQAMVLQ